jgi:hypothetical protein
MQTKSYRLLKWTLLACVSASFASACVVTTGDGDDFFDDGGEGGTNNNTAGTKTNTGGGGKTTTAGTSSGGNATGGGGAATAGTGGSSAGSGGTAPAYEAGICDSASTELEGPTPADPADATLNADDNRPENACRKCLKTNCTDEWSTCYGEDPRIACGWGPANDDQDGQFDCILGCFADGAEDPMGTATELVEECTAMCNNQCEDEDNGNVMFHTSVLVGCANDADTGCQADCFSF